MKRSKEQEQLIIENIRLVYYFANKFKGTGTDYEDFVSMGMIGLIKAADTFDISKGIKFASYASRCINNEFFMYWRKIDNQQRNVSLDDVLSYDKEGNELHLSDLIWDSESDFVEKKENEETYAELISIILNQLSVRENLVMLYRMGGKKQAEIGKKIKVSQSFVTRIEAKGIRKIREFVEQQSMDNKIFNVDKNNNYYVISFSTKNIENYNKRVDSFLKNLSYEFDEEQVAIYYKEDIVKIQIPCEEQSFCILAYIMHEIYKRCGKIKYHNYVETKT